MNYRRIIAFIVLAATYLPACNSNTQDEKVTEPDITRFRRVVLAEEAQGINAATEFDIAPDGKIYMVDLSGHLRIYDPVSSKLKTAAKFEGGEFGLIGVKLDPQFVSNSFIYLQYFIDDSLNKPKERGRRIMRVSRFTMLKDSLDKTTEKNYLKIPYEYACCHTAGGMDFDAQGNLYISTGDNTDAFYTQYSPVVDIPGQDVIFDGLRSPGNTNDDRGKILRIHPEADGSFTIPEGNLFAKGIEKTKPEIYIMGVRNPYRITIDKKTGYLFWGEVGPDASKDSSSGPRGYDEFNMAKAAGNFGWPLVIGNNIPYPHVYYNENRRIGGKADTLHPVNFSVNNTGLKELPPTHPALIWYPYDSSGVFPSLGTGGRTAIGGPFYQYDAALKSTVKFPEWFNHCWFIADWMRNWIKVVRFKEDSIIQSITNFLPDTLFKKPICMKFGPDGALYVLEFGSAWGENPDGRLVRIEYESGNRDPVAKFSADKIYGKTPLTVNLSAGKSFDYDNDALTYEWTGENNTPLAKGPEVKLTFDKPGLHKIKLTVKDSNGGASSVDTILSAGNSMPFINISLPNQSFYWDSLNYTINVNDDEDGTINKGINLSAIKTTLQYFEYRNGYNIAKGLIHSRGEVLLNENDCKSCHQLNAASAGPSFIDIAKRYNKNKNAIPVLAKKIVEGGSGNWGKASNMSAHPQLSIEQTTQIVDYIYSLAKTDYPIQSLPVEGKIALGKSLLKKEETKGYYMLKASYTDKGGESVSALTANASFSLRSPLITAEDFENLYEGVYTDNKFSGRHGSFAAIKNIDLTGINQLQLLASGTGSIEIHLDSASGPLISTALFVTKQKEGILKATLPSLKGFHSLYLVFTSKVERFVEIYLKSVQFIR